MLPSNQKSTIGLKLTRNSWDRNAGTQNSHTTTPEGVDAISEHISLRIERKIQDLQTNMAEKLTSNTDSATGDETEFVDFGFDISLAIESCIDVATSRKKGIMSIRRGVFLQHYHQFKEFAKADKAKPYKPDIDALLSDTSEEKRQIDERKKLLIAEDKIAYDLLPYLFIPEAVWSCHLVQHCHVTENNIKIIWKAINMGDDGIGYYTGTECIDSFIGTRSVTSFRAIPLECHPSAAHLQKSLIERGKLFYDIQQLQHCSYDGPYRKINAPNNCAMEYYRGCVMVDSLAVHREYPRYYVSKIVQKVQHPTEEHYLLCHPFAKAICLDGGNCGEFDVSRLSIIKRPETSFVHEISSLFGAYIEIPPGDGLNVLIHGELGHGKSTLIRNVASHYGRPLYIMAYNNMVLEDAMLDYLRRWRGILLIEDVDRLISLNAANLATLERILEQHKGFIVFTASKLDPMQCRRILARIDWSQRVELGNKEKIWDSILKPRGIMPWAFSRSQNGHEIRNQVKLAQLLLSPGESSVEKLPKDKRVFLRERLDDYKGVEKGFDGYQ